MRGCFCKRLAGELVHVSLASYFLVLLGFAGGLVHLAHGFLALHHGLVLCFGHHHLL